MFTHTYFMQQALQQAQMAFDKGEVPVGAVVVCQDVIIAKAYNQVEQLKDVTAHAEILAISSAANYLGSKYLKNCTLYITLEPCLMCGGAIYWSQLSQLVYGASDEKRGVLSIPNRILHPKTQLIGGICARACGALLQDFFKQKRMFGS